MAPPILMAPIKILPASTYILLAGNHKFFSLAMVFLKF